MSASALLAVSLLTVTIDDELTMGILPDEVPSFRPDTPGDNCDDQVCMSQLSLSRVSPFLLSCQWDVGSNDTNGIDAGNSAYYIYRFSDTDGQYCGPGTNQSRPDSLPTAIQTAVCNTDIRLDDFLYVLFWNTGACSYTREWAQQDQATNANNTFQHCPSTSSSAGISSTTALAATPSTSSSSASFSNSQSSGAFNTGSAGGAVGGVVALVALGLGAWLVQRRRSSRERGTFEVDEPSDIVTAQDAVWLEQHPVTPFAVQKTTDNETPRAHEKHALLRHTDSASSLGSENGSSSTAPIAATSSSKALYNASTVMSDEHEPAREEDAGRIDGSGLPLPPAYRSEWQSE
ncbi:hypothetical protein IEO21_09676 [Rhodonia placenta]|uniref:Uncharacterized protein n=1 Tax=Rhodonia placenta TaxID=104341 RepID=A0A8H7NUA9_9APHY|nr:hypothetical protein IEO21_09676 [Postia placenta]